MLQEFLTAHRTLLIDRCRAAADMRSAPTPATRQQSDGIADFLDQLITTLSNERVAVGPAVDSRSEIGNTAASHGRHLLEQGCSLEQVVREYGDVCQAVSNLALERGAAFGVGEFRTLNRCLDDAIAGAVTEYSSRRAAAAAAANAAVLNTRLGRLAHELRNNLHVAGYAAAAVQSGKVGASGTTGGILERSLQTMRRLIDRTLIEVRVSAAIPPRLQPINVAALIRDASAAAALDPHCSGCRFAVMPVEADLMVAADPELLTSALGNLLQNAFKFTHPESEVRLAARACADRVLIEVADQCGGLPGGLSEELLKPFVQHSSDRSGLGLGLDISRRAVQANNGTLRVRDVPGRGCVFTIDLPRLREPDKTYAI